MGGPGSGRRPEGGLKGIKNTSKMSPKNKLKRNTNSLQTNRMLRRTLGASSNIPRTSGTKYTRRDYAKKMRK